MLDLIFTERVYSALYGRLVRFRRVLNWHDGTPPVAQDRMLPP
ncbi:hypothetical protein [Streptomyces sp. Root369]|nr:hypothetical protein [Streptomyces sp. Root369]